MKQVIGSSLVRLVLLTAVIVVGWTTYPRADEGCKYCIRFIGQNASCQDSRYGTSAPALDICGSLSYTHCTALCMGNCCTSGDGEEEIEAEDVEPM